MPTPWPQGGIAQTLRTRPDLRAWGTEEKAISLGQLRSLKSLLQRVCKAGLLKDKDGRPLEWSHVNQHHIRSNVIMKVIPEESSCSWVELVAEVPQRPTYFVSHNWSEPFRDFMVAIEHHALEVGARTRDTYWICVFALNQHQVNVGGRLEEGPFITALRSSGAGILMVDKTASSLTRLWCQLEVFIMLNKYKECLGWESPNLRILTPMGVLGTPRVQSAPVVEALMNCDTTTSTATEKTDRRQILNYICNRPEATGLKTDGSGNLVVPKELDTSSHPVDAYEAELLKGHVADIKHFDSLIHKWADQHVQQQLASPASRPALRLSAPATRHRRKSEEQASAPSRIPPDRRGLTLAELRHMWRVVKKECLDWQRIGRTRDEQESGDINTFGSSLEDSDPRDLYNKVTLYDFTWEVLKKKQDDEWQISWVESVSEHERDPEYSIIVAYSMPFGDLLAAVEWHAEARELPDTTVYWAWFFSLTLGEIKDWFAKRDGTSPTDIVLKKQGATLEGVVVVIDRDLSTFKRLNPVYELYRFLYEETIGKPCDLCCTVGALSSSRPFSQGGYQFGSFQLEAAEAMVKFDILAFPAATDADRAKKDQILRKLAHSAPDQPAPVSHPNYDAFNRRVRKLGCGLVLRHAAFNGDHKCIERVVQASQVSLLSPVVCGELGEGPLMIAAAQGHQRCMEVLIRLNADVNRQDAQGETPLHYAALAGQAASAQLLIRCSARADIPSIFEELPSDVARQNAAFFLGVDTQGVLDLLLKEESLSRRLAGYDECEVAAASGPRWEPDASGGERPDALRPMSGSPALSLRGQR